jgi:hypothetical protein
MRAPLMLRQLSTSLVPSEITFGKSDIERAVYGETIYSTDTTPHEIYTILGHGVILGPEVKSVVTELPVIYQNYFRLGLQMEARLLFTQEPFHKICTIESMLNKTVGRYNYSVFPNHSITPYEFVTESGVFHCDGRESRKVVEITEKTTLEKLVALIIADYKAHNYTNPIKIRCLFCNGVSFPNHLLQLILWKLKQQGRFLDLDHRLILKWLFRKGYTGQVHGWGTGIMDGVNWRMNDIYPFDKYGITPEEFKSFHHAIFDELLITMDYVKGYLQYISDLKYTTFRMYCDSTISSDLSFYEKLLLNIVTLFVTILDFITETNLFGEKCRTEQIRVDGVMENYVDWFTDFITQFTKLIQEVYTLFKSVDCKRGMEFLNSLLSKHVKITLGKKSRRNKNRKRKSSFHCKK